MQRYPCKALVALHSEGLPLDPVTPAATINLDQPRVDSMYAQSFNFKIKRFTLGDKERLTIHGDKTLHIARSSTDILELEFDCVLDAKELTPVAIYDHTLRPLVSASFIGTNAALVHFVGRRSAGLLSALVSDADSLLSQVCFDLFDTISVRGDTVECSVSLSVLEVRRDAIMDLLHPEQAVELKLHTDLTGRKLWRVGKTSDAVVSTPEEMVDLLILADTRRAVFNNPSSDDATSAMLVSQWGPGSSVPLISITVRRQHANESIRTGRLILADVPVDIEESTLLSLLETLDSLSQATKNASEDAPPPPPAESPAILRILHECFVGNCRSSVLVSAFKENMTSSNLEAITRVLKSVSKCRKIETRVQTNLLRSNAELNQIIELLSAENRWRSEAIGIMN